MTTPKENVESAKEEEEMSTFQTILIMSALGISVFLGALDVTIITTSLSTIAAVFQSSAGYTWIGSVFQLGTASSTLVWGKLSDIWGRKPILLIAIAIFFVGSLLCGAAVNMSMLLLGRTVQGVGAGGLLTLVNICISDLFSMRNRAKYYGVIGMVWAFASAVGPIIGGALTERVSWRWCFYINLPVTSLAFAIVFFRLELETPKTSVLAGLKSIDWIGSLTVTGATVMFLLGLEWGGITYPWSSAIVLCLLIFGIITFGLFMVNEKLLATYPIMPPHLFNVSNAASLLGCFIHGMVFIAGTFYLPLYFQAVLGATVLESGTWLMAFAIAISTGSAATGIYIKKTGRYLDAIRFGAVITTLGFGLFIDLPSDRDWAKIIIFQILAGIGVGPHFQSYLIALQNNVARSDMATATATFAFIRALGVSISIVVGGVIFQNGMQQQQSMLQANLGNEVADLLLGGNVSANIFLVDTLPTAQKEIARAALMSALRNIWFLTIGLAGLGLVVIFFVKVKTLSKEHEAVHVGLEVEEARRKALADEKRAQGAAENRGVAVEDV